MRDRVFLAPESGAVTDRYVAVRILGGDEFSDANHAVAAEYDALWTPTLLALAPDGALLARRSGKVQSVGELLAFLVEAEKEGLRYAAEERELSRRTTVAARRALARFYAARYQHAKALPLLDGLVRGQQALEDQLVLLEILHRTDDTAALRSLCKALIAAHPGHPLRMSWELRLERSALRRVVVPIGERRSRMDQQLAILERLLETERPDQDRSEILYAISEVYDWIRWYVDEAPPGAFQQMQTYAKRALDAAVIEFERPALMLALAEAALAVSGDPEKLRTLIDALGGLEIEDYLPNQEARRALYARLLRKKLESLEAAAR